MQQAVSTNPTLEIPEDIICPISHQIMTEPVILIGSGHTYEREEILKWLEKNATDPLTNEKITSKAIAENKTLKKVIVSFLEKQKEKNPDIINETYLPYRLIQELITAIEKNEINTFVQALSADSRLLNEDLKENKNLFMLTCETGSLEMLNIILGKLSEKVLSMPCVESDKGLSLFLSVSRRLGIESSRTLSAAFQWKEKNLQTVLKNAVKENDLIMVEICLSLGAIPDLELLNESYTQKQTEILKILISAGVPIKEKDRAGNDFLMRSIIDNYTDMSLFLVKEKLENKKIKIQNLKLENQKQKTTIERLEISQAFFTSEKKETVISKEQKIEQKYQVLREQKRQEEEKFEQIKIKQNPYIAALLKGDLKEAKKLELEGASLTEPDTEGTYPLVAAVYSTNIEAVKYLELKLKDEAIRQWAAIDVNKARDLIDHAMPKDLPPIASFGDFKKWYSMNADMPWTRKYDEECLKECLLSSKFSSLMWWESSWNERVTTAIEFKGENYVSHGVWMYGCSSAVVQPGRMQHDKVVIVIREQLNELRKEVEIKTENQQNKFIK